MTASHPTLVLYLKFQCVHGAVFNASLAYKIQKNVDVLKRARHWFHASSEGCITNIEKWRGLVRWERLDEKLTMEVWYRVVVTLSTAKKMSNFGSSQNGGDSCPMLDLELLWPLASWILATLLWVILAGMIFALLIQTLAANLGVKTGRHLAELCREEYPRYVNIFLWIIAELAVISDDIPEVLGTAFAFNILLKVPVWAGVILTVFSTLLLLGVQRFGARKLEFIIAAFMFTMAACFFGELSYLRPSAREVVKGMFVPSLQGKGAAANAIALFGAIITPYNLFLHSAVVLSRKTPRSVKSIRTACRFFLIECTLAFIVAFLINVAVVVVAGGICNSNSISPADANTCSDLTLQSAPLLLRNVLGRSSSVVYAVALLASGQSTTISCTFAGQVIMQGFLDMKMKNWVRNLITRVIAIAPSLIVAVVSGPSGAGKLIIFSSMVLSFELPFALIPLLKFCNSSKKVGPLKESIYTVVIAWILSFALIVVNTYFLVWSYVDWMNHNHLPKYANALISIVVFTLMAAYLVAIVYLTFRRDTVITYVSVSDRAQGQVEAGTSGALASAADADQPPPFRKELADASM